jgi:RimJ/RimL family protein N-acetyltransferase
MPAVFMEGDLVQLTTMSVDDVDLGAYAGWANDRETTRFMGIGPYPVTEHAIQDYVRSFDGRPDAMILAIREKGSGRHIGNITLQDIDWRDRRGEIGILLGEEDARGKGCGTEAIGLVVRHAFERLGLTKLTAGVISGNEASKRAFEKNGFVVEGVLRQHHFTGGSYRDALRLGLLASEARLPHDDA